MANTSPGEAQTIATKFLNRSRALASDGFIIYDIQDEPSRSGEARPFPFRELMDSSRYAALVARTSGKPCLVYKCCEDGAFDKWAATAARDHGHQCVNVVGRPSSTGAAPKGPTHAEAMKKVKAQGLRFGCVCIPERHTDEYAASRGKAAPTEHENMLRKQRAGAEWFVSQAVYDPAPTIRLLKDYAAACRVAGISPKKIVLTLAPCGRAKTLAFLKWLGVRVPEAAEKRILDAKVPVDESVALLCEVLTEILGATRHLGVPLGISVESVSIFKAEINAVHDLFRKTQVIMLDEVGTPWKVVWQKADDDAAVPPSEAGVFLKKTAAPPASTAEDHLRGGLRVAIACASISVAAALAALTVVLRRAPVALL